VAKAKERLWLQNTTMDHQLPTIQGNVSNNYDHLSSNRN